MDILAKIAFGVYTLVILLGGVAAISARSLVRALVGLIATLFGVAGLYLLMAAPFVAFMQLLIYVGAVAVLVFLAIMLTQASAQGEEGQPRPIRQQRNAGLVGLLTLAVLGMVVVLFGPESQSVPATVTAKELGKGLMEPYVLAFELISVVLSIAMGGAVLLTWEKREKKS